MTRIEILKHAAKITGEDRNAEYGTPDGNNDCQDNQRTPPTRGCAGSKQVTERDKEQQVGHPVCARTNTKVEEGNVAETLDGFRHFDGTKVQWHQTAVDDEDEVSQRNDTHQPPCTLGLPGLKTGSRWVNNVHAVIARRARRIGVKKSHFPGHGAKRQAGRQNTLGSGNM